VAGAPVKRARPDDTQPMRSAERTDPGGFRPPEATPVAADTERERMEQLIAAFDRAPKRPSPNYAERAYSAGGNAVGYSAMVTPSPAREAERHEDRVLVDLAALARNARAPAARASSTGRDNTTVSPARETTARRRLWLAVGASAALAVVGIASVRARSSSVAPATRASGAETASVSPAASSTAGRTALPLAAPVAEQPPVAAAPSLQAPSTNAAPPIHAHPESAVHAVKHAPPAAAKPANDPTLDDLDRVP
jgi:hypothetical protein